MSASGSSNIGAACPGCSIARRFYSKNFFLMQPQPRIACADAFEAVARSLHIIDRVDLRLLGGLTPREFLRRHWQKRPLFVRAALPGFSGAVDFGALAKLAQRDDVESRIVQRRGVRWNTEHGPFASVRAEKSNWTLLVSGVNLHAPRDDALLRRFSFVPQ